MIEIKIPKEIKQYEAKLVGPFTARQCVVLLICVPIVGVLYYFLRTYVNATIAAYLCMPIAGIGALFGWVKPYGLTFEKYMQSVFVNAFVAPRVRVYKTENYYSLLSKKAKSLTNEDELILDAILEEVPEEQAKEALKELRKANKKMKSIKYSKSKKVIR